jgi:hypothetical protein
LSGDGGVAIPVSLDAEESRVAQQRVPPSQMWPLAAAMEARSFADEMRRPWARVRCAGRGRTSVAPPWLGTRDSWWADFPLVGWCHLTGGPTLAYVKPSTHCWCMQPCKNPSLLTSHSYNFFWKFKKVIFPKSIF